jgi:hypothetical protein
VSRWPWSGLGLGGLRIARVSLGLRDLAERRAHLQQRVVPRQRQVDLQQFAGLHAHAADHGAELGRSDVQGVDKKRPAGFSHLPADRTAASLERADALQPERMEHELLHDRLEGLLVEPPDLRAGEKQPACERHAIALDVHGEAASVDRERELGLPDPGEDPVIHRRPPR